MIVCNQINAETYTIINSIQVNGVEIPKEHWNGLAATANDSITFYFILNGDKSSAGDIEYKIFLTGSNSVPALNAYKKDYYTLKNLNEGEYIFKVQGFVKNTETVPAVIRFAVKNNGALVKDNNLNKNNSDSGSFSSGNIIIVSFLSILVVGLIVALIKLKSKVKVINKDKSSAGYRNISKDSGVIKTQVTADKFTKSNPDQAENEEELFDYKYAYNNLRKEYERLKDENSFLKNQIDELNTNVKDLENANIQLSKQKERLLDSKRQLEELQAQKEELFTIALHDIKNPAAAIKGFVELLEDYDLNANDQQEIMQSLMDTSSKIIELAQQMSVAIARQAPEPALNPEKASIKVITDSVCKRNIAYAKKKGINLVNNTSPNTPETLIDIFKIEEVIDNLINNAIKYSPVGTIVYLRSYFSDNKITIEVEDNGVGLSEDDVKKAFRKGVLLSSIPTGDETRAGLGLWISKKIVEEHGGKIWMKSKLGIGTKVGFDLPIRRNS